MKNLNLAIEYFSTTAGATFEETTQRIIDQLDFGKRTPLRFVFFGIPQSDYEYCNELTILKTKVKEKFGKHTPVISYVSQRPLCNNALVLEAHSTEISSERVIHHRKFEHTDYITVEDSNAKKLSLGGIIASDFRLSIFDQSMQIFDKIKKIMELENMPINSIVRQWNYIANITLVKDDKQHYQEFNDARSHFYNQTNWPAGYPAATGIGTENGGVVVDLFAVTPKKENVSIFALDNKLQVAAHAYSQQVLIGQEDAIFKTRTTPKFERGKVVYANKESLVYISGTAAIRGEASLEGVGIKTQTVTTLENIDYLTSVENLQEAGVPCVKAVEMKSLRIYLKEPQYYDEAKKVVDSMSPEVPSVYLLGDICRDNLLIEIEGIATNY